MSRTRNQFVALALAGIVCLSGCSVVPAREPIARPTQQATDRDVMAGAKLFSQHCASCHGIDASGGQRAPSLRSPFVRTTPDAVLVRFLADGNLRRGMPSWSRLPQERRQQLVRFLKSMTPPPNL